MYVCSFIHLTSLFLCQVRPHIRGLRRIRGKFIAVTGLFLQQLFIYADSPLFGILVHKWRQAGRQAARRASLHCPPAAGRWIGEPVH